MSAANKTFTVISASPEHAHSLAAIHRASFTSGWGDGDLSDMLAISGTYAFMACDGENPTGMIICRNLHEQGEVLTMAVLPPWRRHGAGQALLAAALAYAKAQGVKVMLLEVEENNLPAIGLYEQAGFVVSGQRKEYYRQPDNQYTDALVMRLELA